MRLRLYHHVYSSLGGYKTLYRSEPLPEAVVAALDSFASRLYAARRTSPGDLHFWFSLHDAFYCISKIFFNGADHAGRPRSCVHTVLLDLVEASRAAYFNPFILDDSVFLSSDADLSRLGAALVQTTAPSVEPEGLETYLSQIDLTDEVVAALYLRMVTAGQAVVADANGMALDALRLLSLLTPRPLRLNLTVTFGLQPDLGPRRPAPRLAILAPGLARERPGPNDTVIDLATGQVENPPPPCPFHEFVRESWGDPAGRARVVKLLRLMERFREQAAFSTDQLTHYLTGFHVAETCFDEEGGLEPALESGVLLDAAPHFSRAGHHQLVHALLNGCFELVKEAHGVPEPGDAPSEEGAIAVAAVGRALGDLIKQAEPPVLDLEEAAPAKGKDATTLGIDSISFDA